MDKRFAAPGKKKSYEIQRLWEHHHQVKRLLVISNGSYTNRQIADIVGCSKQTVSNVRNHPLMRAELEKMMAAADAEAINVGKQIREIAPLAVEVMRETMEDSLDEYADPKVRALGVRSAIATLDHAHPKQTRGTVLHGHLSLGQIQDLKNKVKVEQSVPTEAVMIEEGP